MASLFTKIIAGEIPAHRVYADEHTIAFLDINPRQEGHTLVVPKREVDYLFDLPTEDYEAVWAAVQTVATALKAATGCARVVLLVVGYDIAHAHVHLIPTRAPGDVPFPPVDREAAVTARLEQTAARVRAAIG